jgi:hypothetical protein
MIGQKIADVQHMFKLCRHAHATLLADVPVAGWDVAVTSEGTYLLEANLSCNFFLGNFDHKSYFDFVYEVFSSFPI